MSTFGLLKKHYRGIPGFTFKDFMNPWKRKEVIGDCTLYLGDCLEILPTLEKVDAVITDPPYGIGALGKHDGGGGGAKSTWKHDPSVAKAFDMSRPSRAAFDAAIAASKEQVIWGGNYFTDILPPKMCWLVWDKCLHGFTTSDFEMAWTSFDKAARRFEYPCGNERGFAPLSKEPLRFINAHPTQKPVKVMEWCIKEAKEPQTVCDPFMGSGTTGVACANLGRKFIGIELKPKYFDIACERITNAYRQERLFT
jgi:DNA modification methylase